jgi:lantibiotic leader peptide-processing serine protease
MRYSFLRKPLLFAAFAVAAIVAAVFVFRPAPAGAQSFETYVFTANTWGPAQNAAIAAAGGSVTFSHRKTGIGVAASASPNFLSLAMGSGAFKTGAQDMMVQWQPPVREGQMIAAAITPGDETFFNAQWNIKAVEAEEAWAAGYTGKGVRVAVLDGGIYTSHADLAGRMDMARSKSFVPGQPFNYDTGTFWHGTHVAGIIAAEDNGIGTIGIAPEATIIGVKVLHGGGGYFSWLIPGILYASTPISQGGAGADIINMSLEGVFPRGGGPTGAAWLVSALNKAVNYAGKNTLVVSAAGNDGADLDHSGSWIVVPAMSGSGIAVSATGPMGFGVNWPNGATNFRRIASYTNYGNSLVWLAAPGGDYMLPGEAVCWIPRLPSGDIFQYCWALDMVISTIRGPDDLYWYYSWAAGTSMAAPAVSAVAALVKQRFPWFTAGDIKSWLAATADDEGKPGNDPYYGKGFVNAYRAVTE